MKQKKNAATSFYEDEDEDLLQAVDGFQDAEEDEIPEDEYIPELPQIKPPTRQGRPLITRERKVDTLTTVRTREFLTKTMCKRRGCNYDASKAMGFAGYKRVPPSRRDEAKELLQIHMTHHGANDEHIVFESDLQTQWFGTDMTGKGKTHI